MNDKIKQLEIKKILQEYNFLLVDDEYKHELIESNKIDFLKSIEDTKKELGIVPPEPPTPEEVPPGDEEAPEKPAKEPKIKNITESTRLKLKKIYRLIVKLTHPDKFKSEELLAMYIRAKEAYADNNLLDLYLICIDLKIEIDLDQEDITNIVEVLNLKRKEVSDLEASFLWLWIHSPNEESKNIIVMAFIDKHVR